MTALPAQVHEYRVRFPVDSEAAPGEVEVRVTVDLERQAIHAAVPGWPAAVLDVVTARALSMLLWHAVFTSLRPSGPHLRVEKDTGGGWSDEPGVRATR